ncbi:MAG: DUF2726 domain-containing protein [Patescibacteria group bacterium]
MAPILFFENLNIFFLLVVIFVLLGIVYFFKSLESLPSKKKEIHRLYYRTRSSILDKREMAFFYELQKQLPAQHYIFPKMRIADILETTAQGREYYRQRNKILPKHIDFLICDSNFQPLIAIELNGFSHQRKDRIDRDVLVKNIFESATMKLVFVNVGDSFETAINDLLKNLKHEV